MKEIKANIWDFHGNGDWIVITTNGSINSKGQAVMGKGLALQCKKLYSEFPIMLGEMLAEQGNRIGVFLDYKIITLPVKHNWNENADLRLIESGLRQLPILLNSLEVDKLYLTRAGCGNGNLKWENQVKPLFEKYLDNRFIVCNI